MKKRVFILGLLVVFTVLSTYVYINYPNLKVRQYYKITNKSNYSFCEANYANYSEEKQLNFKIKKKLNLLLLDLKKTKEDELMNHFWAYSFGIDDNVKLWPTILIKDDVNSIIISTNDDKLYINTKVFTLEKTEQFDYPIEKCQVEETHVYNIKNNEKAKKIVSLLYSLKS